MDNALLACMLTGALKMFIIFLLLEQLLSSNGLLDEFEKISDCGDEPSLSSPHEPA
jgi:hypothetical protein